MAEALAALSLAGNIVQFVDISCNLFFTAKEIHSSVTGASQQNQALFQTTRNLKAVCDSLADATTPSKRADSPLTGLAFNCQETGRELIEILESIVAEKPQSKRSAFRAAVSGVWSQGKIEGMARQLDRYRTQLILDLELLRKLDSSNMLSKLEAIQHFNVGMNTKIDHQTAQIKLTIYDAIQRLESEFRRQQREQFPEKHSRIGSSQLTVPAQDVSELSASLVKTSATTLELLQSLCFENMTYRYGRVAEAYPQTFHWMFSNDFVQWLQSDDSVFWISGKPGSGKSTLMKFLVQENRTIEALHSWAGDQQLVVCNYFFWVNGTSMQRSDEGLLRSIFYDILRQCPNLIEKSFPTQCAAISMGHRQSMSWSRSELLAGFRRLVQHNDGQVRFCLFIDGLDEYDGDCDELVDVVRILKSSKDVKICAASRPWNVFEAAFGGFGNHTRKLYLQDLNKSDIETYVRAKIGFREDFSALRLRESGADALMNEITAKSQGVFLWVHLVVRSLIQGLQNADRIFDLRRRVNAFPSDLNDFFGHIFLSLDQIYRHQTARSFRIALAANKPASLFNYYYLDIEETDMNFVRDLPIRSIDTKELKDTLEQMKIRVNGRCKGLLEVTNDSKQSQPVFRLRVDFLHRTVKDFLLTKDMDSMLKDWSEGFDPNLALAKTTLAELKSVPMTGFHFGRGGQASQFLNEFFRNMKEYELRHKRSPEPLMDEMEKTYSKLFAAFRPVGRAVTDTITSSFFMLTLSWDLHEYAKVKCRQGLVGNSLSEKKNVLERLLAVEDLPKNTLGKSLEYRSPLDDSEPTAFTSGRGTSIRKAKKGADDDYPGFPHNERNPENFQTNIDPDLPWLVKWPTRYPDPELLNLILRHGPAVTLDDRTVRKLHKRASTGHDKPASSVLELLTAGEVISPDAIAAMNGAHQRRRFNVGLSTETIDNYYDWGHSQSSISSQDAGEKVLSFSSYQKAETPSSSVLTHEQRKKSGPGLSSQLLSKLSLFKRIKRPQKT